MTYAGRVTHVQRAMGAKQNYVTAYYGSQALTSFPLSVMREIDAANAYVDLTAGGGGMVYHQADKYGKRVGYNDRCYYAYLGMSAVLEPAWDLDQPVTDWFEDFGRKTHPDNVQRLSLGNGYLSKLDTKAAKISDELRRYIDSLCVWFNQDALVLSTVGRVIVNNFTFRAFSWCGSDPSRKKVSDWSPEDFWTKMMRAAMRARAFYNRLVPSPHEVLWGDAKHAAYEMNVEGALVYSDPAWPWADTGPNPYEWFHYDLSGILLQEDLPEIRFWQRGDFDNIVRETAEWGTLVLERDARGFILSTQGTNAPVPEEVFRAVGEHIPLKWTDVVTAQSLGAAKPFTEHFAMFAG